jgi:hypothetical protein
MHLISHIIGINVILLHYLHIGAWHNKSKSILIDKNTCPKEIPEEVCLQNYGPYQMMKKMLAFSLNR